LSLRATAKQSHIVIHKGIASSFSLLAMTAWTAILIWKPSNSIVAEVAVSSFKEVNPLAYCYWSKYRI